MSRRVIAHMDMDAFFAAVEVRDNPSLRGKPVIIGADPRGGSGRGVVSTCSYEARKFGVHSALPISVAYKKCPQGIYLRGNHRKYSQVSKSIFKILEDFTPDIQPISIDEAFMDLTGSYHFFGTPLKTCQEIRRRIKQEIGLNASIGIAPNKMIAKIASDYCKPDGLIEITPQQARSFLWKLPISKMWGVGKKMQQSLHALKIFTVGELAQYPVDRLIDRYGSHGAHLHRLANGIDERPVQVRGEIKSVSHEHTFNSDTTDRDEIIDTMLLLCEKISRRMRRYDLKGRTIGLKLRLSGFKTYTRAHTIADRVNFSDVIYETALKLFNEFHGPGMRYRLIGVRVSNFEDQYVSDSLFKSARDERDEKLHRAFDAIKDKYGEGAIRRGLYKDL